MKRPFDIVTGGAGFIGSHLCRALVGRGGRVRVIDDFSTGRPENLALLVDRHPDHVEVLEMDIRDRRGLGEAFQGVEVVYHQAAMTSVEESLRDPLKVNDVNVSGTLSVLTAAREAGARKLIFASSTAIYGDSPELPKREQMAAEPCSPYAVTKLSGELYCKLFSSLYRLPTVCLRYFNVFGPRQDPKSEYAAVVPRFITRMLQGEPPIVYGDGGQTRDFVFVEDVVAANLLAASSAADGVSLNVASGESVSLIELLQTLGAIQGADLKTVYEKPRKGEIRHSAASLDLAEKTIGFRPRVSLKQGLEKTVRWYEKQR